MPGSLSAGSEFRTAADIHFEAGYLHGCIATTKAVPCHLAKCMRRQTHQHRRNQRERRTWISPRPASLSQRTTETDKGKQRAAGEVE